MIVQTVRYSNTKGVGIKKSIANHMDYIFRDYGQHSEIDELVYYHNIPIRQQSPEGAKRAFQSNEKYRHEKNAQNKQKGHSVNSLHSVDEIISVEPIDREEILENPWIIQDFAKELMHKIAPGGIGVAVIHIDKEHIHVHCYRHAFKYKQLENTRADNDMFVGVRQHLEKIQRERYPQLQTKIVYNELDKGMKDKKQGKRKSQKNALKFKERTNQILEKDLMSNALSDFHKIAQNHSHFLELLENHKIEFYYRGDKEKGQAKNVVEGKKPAGVWVGNKKMRFSTLGLSKEVMNELEKRGEKEREKKDRVKNILSKYTRYRRPDGKDRDEGIER